MKKLLLILVMISLNMCDLKDVCESINTFSQINKDKLNNLNFLNYLEKEGKVIGKGAFGQVYKIKFGDSTLSVKQLIYNFMNEKEIRFYHENQNLKGIPKYHCCAFGNGKILLLQELLYQSLFDRFPKGSRRRYFFQSVNYDENLEIYIQIAEEIKELFDHGYLHADIKNMNIMYTDNTYSKVKLIDFGLTTKLDITPVMGGSPIYLAPEYNGLNLAKKPFDIFAFGMTIIVNEIGLIEVYSILQNDLVNLKVLQSTLNKVNDRFKTYIAYKNSGLFSRFWKWVKSCFGIEVVVRKSPVYDLSDLAKELTTYSSNQRPTIEETIEKLKKLKENKDLKDKNEDNNKIAVL